MKLSTWARQVGLHPRTAYRWFHAGALPVPARQLASGTILVEPTSSDAGEVAVYARGSSADQRSDLDRQVARLAADATTGGLISSRASSRRGPWPKSVRR
jgi:putative resolvase